MKLSFFHAASLAPVLSQSNLVVAATSSSSLRGIDSTDDRLLEEQLADSSERHLGKKSCDTRVNNTKKKLLECVTVVAVREHQAAFQAIADANNGNRASGTPGYDASVDYIVDRMEGAGYDVMVQTFQFTRWAQIGPSTLEQTAPNTVTYVEGVDYTLFKQTEPGDVTGLVEAVDLSLDEPSESTSGCEESDFGNFTPGKIALVQRGECTFALKAENAARAGAVGAIVFNQGNTEDRKGLPSTRGTLGANYNGGIPVMFASFDRGVEWAGTTGLKLHMIANVFLGEATSYNVLAETKLGSDDTVIMVGAHLDSVQDGPGVQDNGSGSAVILEVAEKMANVKPHNKVRFAWWGAEESGLLGSNFYVANLSDKKRKEIGMYLNFDMVGSPNFVRFIQDGDGSAGGAEGPTGSGVIEKFFEDFYADRELAFEPFQLAFRTDYSAFYDIDVPFGGLFTGAEGVKTLEQAAVYGGTAGEQYDPCYHLACDTFDNISLEVLGENAQAVAAATLHFSMIEDLALTLTDTCRSNLGRKACENAGCFWDKKGTGARDVEVHDEESDETTIFHLPPHKCSAGTDGVQFIMASNLDEGAEAKEQPNSGYGMATVSAWAIVPMVMLWF